MRPLASIRQRLTFLLAGVAAVLSILSWLTVSEFARRAVGRAQDNVLAASVTSIVETLRAEEGEVQLELPYSAFSMLGAISEDRVFYRAVAGGLLLTGYGDLPEPRPEPPEPGGVVFATADYVGETIRMASATRIVAVAGNRVPVSVTVAQTTTGITQVARDLSRMAALLSVAFFCIAVTLSAIAARASLKPLSEIAGAVARRGPSDMRPLRRRAPAELSPLIEALDRLMLRLAGSLRRSEDFIAEAAHRIRTPLASVRMQSELALGEARTSSDRARLRLIIRAVDESSRSAGQLLDHATVAFRAEDLARDPVDLSKLALRTADAIRPTATMRDIEISLRADPALVSGDAVLLDTALRNVLDNAVKYSPVATDIHIAVGVEGGEAFVRVCDQGPGLGGGPLDALTERFRRGETAAGHVGSGLGLTITRDVLRAHGGRLILSNRDPKEGGGACVSLILPSA
ncbi:sensor histidine kinase [Profundibacterium mesophilum]|uniref:histidine kinase n=1 Tax=Profundibacterium mesophilum KAUST100406-0324 TaxID=1037889 RepID=A0A921NV04_9RHOB|nr:sensor histidine kinase [Profundibacterium mesophilum]KAF0677179.1 two-component system OmpR family sensor histidine kinase TctE [Profundibacterium mesophilum KAUST100406-0324]